jgi:hypothetical protein
MKVFLREHQPGPLFVPKDADDCERGVILGRLAPRDGLLGAARLALRVALKGDRRRYAASSNPFLRRGFDRWVYR